jgi:hypothetical protein
LHTCSSLASLHYFEEEQINASCTTCHAVALTILIYPFFDVEKFTVETIMRLAVEGQRWRSALPYACQERSGANFLKIRSGVAQPIRFIRLPDYQITNWPHHSGAPVGATPPTRSHLRLHRQTQVKTKPQSWLPPAHPYPLPSQCMSGQPTSICQRLTC